MKLKWNMKFIYNNVSRETKWDTACGPVIRGGRRWWNFLRESISELSQIQITIQSHSKADT